jgi:hypothetical protein
MDGDKDDKSLFEKAIETVKDIASSVTEAVKSAPPSARTEKAPSEEDLDAPPMTAEEIAQHAAADTQPVIPAKNAIRGKTASPSMSGRITPTYDFPPPDFPMPSRKTRKAAVRKAKKSAKKFTTAAKETIVKKAVKKTAKKAKKAVSKKSAKKSRKAKKRSKR